MKERAPYSELLQLFRDLCGTGAVAVGGCAARVANHASLVDDKCCWAVTELSVNPHLKGDAIRCADGLSWVEQQREIDIGCLEPSLLEQVLGRPRLVGINCQQLGVEPLERGKLVAQLRELAVADGSRIAIDKHEHDSLLASVVAESVVLSRDGGQPKVRRQLVNLR